MQSVGRDIEIYCVAGSYRNFSADPGDEIQVLAFQMNETVGA